MALITRMSGIYTKMTGTTGMIAMTMTGMSWLTGVVVMTDAVVEVGHITQMFFF